VILFSIFTRWPFYEIILSKTLFILACKVFPPQRLSTFRRTFRLKNFEAIGVRLVTSLPNGGWTEKHINRMSSTTSRYQISIYFFHLQTMAIFSMLWALPCLLRLEGTIDSTNPQQQVFYFRLKLFKFMYNKIERIHSVITRVCSYWTLCSVFFFSVATKLKLDQGCP
jgi:hypothetical protein